MVVHHDDAARSRENRGAKDLARVHERGIDDPTTHFLDGPYCDCEPRQTTKKASTSSRWTRGTRRRKQSAGPRIRSAEKTSVPGSRISRTKHHRGRFFGGRIGGRSLMALLRAARRTS